jgi:acyl-CoA oxidase
MSADFGITTVREQGFEEQKAYWMPKILNYDIIGYYAPTELGHGSNVRGLETIAGWDPFKKEFELHSPYLNASKSWNRTMGRTATHAMSDDTEGDLTQTQVYL